MHLFSFAFAQHVYVYWAISSSNQKIRDLLQASSQHVLEVFRLQTPPAVWTHTLVADDDYAILSAKSTIFVSIKRAPTDMCKKDWNPLKDYALKMNDMCLQLYICNIIHLSTIKNCSTKLDTVRHREHHI